MNKPSIIAALLKCDRRARINGADWWLAGSQRETSRGFALRFDSAPVCAIEFDGNANRHASAVTVLRVKSTPGTTWRIENGAVVIEGVVTE